MQATLLSTSQWEAIFAGAVAAAGLTTLTLDIWPSVLGHADDTDDDDDDADDDENGGSMATQVAACASLAKLTCLQNLTLSGPTLLRGDALALTALTRLTRLDLNGARQGVGTAAATALARSLQQLQSLDLFDCCLQLGGAYGFVCLEAVGCLTQLTQLSFSENEGLTQHDLMRLTGLPRLDQAACEYLCDGVQQEALEAFWAAVHAQRL
jgi:hypothetical protein